jgi:tetratricopeptide (TPR) repeat protein
MTRPICPMLQALPATDAAGQPVNRECLLEPCRFYDREARDCSLSLAAATTTRLAADAARQTEASASAGSHAEAAAARLGSLEARLAATELVLADLLTRVASLHETQQQAAGRLLEEMSLLAARHQKAEATMGALSERLQRSEDNARGILESLQTQRHRDQADLDARRRDEAVLTNNRGVALYYRGAFEAARDSFLKALELLPDYAEAHNNLGLVYSRLGEGEKAVESFRRALTADPKMGEAYNNLGFLYHTTAQFDRAAQMFGLAIENAGESSIAYANLGNTFYAMKQADRAVEAWTRAVDLDPMNESARRGLRMYEQDASAN